MDDLTKKVERELISFAEEHKWVEAVGFGSFPDLDGNPRDFYVIISSTERWNPDKEDEITKLDLRIYKDFEYSISLMHLPIGIEQVKTQMRIIYERKED